MLNLAFADVLFGPGQPLDIRKYFIVSAGCNIGHGSSSKPSDGLHARFPHYDYDDMVRSPARDAASAASRSIICGSFLGTSMGCMESFVLGRDLSAISLTRSLPLACLPVALGGRIG